MKYDAVCTDGKGNASLGGIYLYGSGAGYNNFAYPCVPSNGGKQIASLPNGNPIVGLSQLTAASYSQNIGAHLITNNEWQTIAWNAESQPQNWNGGVVGASYFYSGHNDGSPNKSIVADSNDANGYAGETNQGGNQRRTLFLSNGAVIWDMAGNIWQYTNDTIGGIQSPHGGPTGWNWIELTAVTTWGGTTQQAVGGTNPAWNSSQGMGQLMSENTAVDPGPYAFSRGGEFDQASQSGIEGLSLTLYSFNDSYGVTFRCAR
jgi:formylglycine-generating enzyme required for sulfatase activity